MEVLGKISPELYWEWRTTIEEQKCARLQHELMLMKGQAMEKDIEIQKLRAAIFKSTSVITASEKVQEREKEYENIKKRIEEASGVELKDCVIDEITYEIKRMG